MKGRDLPDRSAPLSDQATGLWFVVPGRRKMQRFDEAAPHDGTVHWYRDNDGWHAFRETDVRPVR